MFVIDLYKQNKKYTIYVYCFLRIIKENQILLISAVICTIVIIAISTIFFILEMDKSIAFGFLFLLPFSWWIGYYIPKKENDKKIKECTQK